jgi:hypothetical protein
VEEALWLFGLLAGITPGSVVTNDLFPVPVKDIGASLKPLLLSSTKNIHQLADNDNHSSVFILGNLRAQADDVTMNISPFYTSRECFCLMPSALLPANKSAAGERIPMP